MSTPVRRLAQRDHLRDGGPRDAVRALRRDDRGHRLQATLWGEPVDVARHAPACEPKGATYTALGSPGKRAVLVGRLRRRRMNGPAMDTNRFTRIDATTWRVDPHGAMRVPAVIYADENLIRDMDDKVHEQAANVARCRASSKPPMPCPMRTGDTAFPSAAWPLSIPMRAAWCRRAASASTSPAACAQC